MARGPSDVFLHIGAMKTGTSYLQRLLVDNKKALAADGVLFPGHPGWGGQVRGVRDILGLGADNEVRSQADGAWEPLREEIANHDGPTALLSMEFMSFARAPRARALVESLAPSAVHVVLTVRDAGRVLPAQWQESTQNRGTSSWREYIEAVMQGADSRGDVWRTSMRALNIPRMLSIWAPLVPPERLHVVIVPPPGAPSTQLWERFASAVGLDPLRYEPPSQRRNESLGYVSADLMRRANVELRKLPITSYQGTVKHLCKHVLAGREGEPKVPMTTALADFAAHWNATIIEAVVGSRGHVYGDLADLDVKPPATVETVEPPATADLLAAAADALAGLEKLIEVRRRKVAALRSGHAEPGDDEDPTATEPERAVSTWEAAPDPVAAAVADIVATARRAADLRLQLRRLRA